MSKQGFGRRWPSAVFKASYTNYFRIIWKL